MHLNYNSKRNTRKQWKNLQGDNLVYQQFNTGLIFQLFQPIRDENISISQLCQFLTGNPQQIKQSRTEVRAQFEELDNDIRFNKLTLEQIIEKYGPTLIFYQPQLKQQAFGVSGPYQTSGGWDID